MYDKCLFLTEATDNFTLRKLYHVSENPDLDGTTLIPRVPDNWLIKKGFEDPNTKRVAFTTSIDGCLIALSANLKGKTLYVYQAEDSKTLKNKPNSMLIDLVPDAHITGEVWILEPVKIRFIQKIIVHEAIEPGIVMKYGNQKTKVYKWKWGIA
jgi:hypothetical protein